VSIFVTYSTKTGVVRTGYNYRTITVSRTWTTDSNRTPNFGYHHERFASNEQADRRNDRGGAIGKNAIFSLPSLDTRPPPSVGSGQSRSRPVGHFRIIIFNPVSDPSPNYIYVFICTYKSGFRFWKEQTVLKSPERFLFYLFLPRFDSRRRPLSAVQTFFFVQNYRTYVTQCTFFFLYFVIIIVENGRRDREYCW